MKAWGKSSVWLLWAAACPAFAIEPGENEVLIYRDDFGVPHIFGDSIRSMAFGMGYAQAEDRTEQLFKQYRHAVGRMSEVYGPRHFQDDYRARLWNHAAVAKAGYSRMSDESKALMEGFQAGVRRYIADHPDKKPASYIELEPWMCAALSRYIIWGWPEGDAAEDMERGGIQPQPRDYRGSNEWLVAPQRTAEKAVIALIDPHLSWYDQFRFYEARLYGGPIEFSGMAIVGLPLPSLGHSRYCSIAMTTGGPDCADCYRETVNPHDPRQYRYDGRWRDMTTRTETIRVKDADVVKEKSVEIVSTHHGPVVAHKDGFAYTLKLAYADEFQLLDQGVRMALARNLAEMKQALSMLQLMEQNVMIGTVDGDVFYVRNGRVPIRPEGVDATRPIDGSTSKTEWRGIHPFDALIQVHNPPQGYMQNCNVSPQFLMKDCPVQPDQYKRTPELFNGFYDLARRFDHPLHQRAAMCLELLDAEKDMTVEEAIETAMSPAVFGVDRWQEKLRKAWAGAGENRDLDPFVRVVLDWSRRCDPDAVGAVAYRYWKDEMPEVVRLHDRAGFPPHPAATEALVLESVVKGAAKMKADWGRFDVSFGEAYRVGRRGAEKNWPVGGGSVRGIETPRAISFDAVPGSKRLLGRGGQTSTQIVLLTRPPRSWTVLPLGQSDDPNSPHFDDQAEKLFSKGRMKPTFFLDKEALLQHTRSTKRLKL